MRKISSHVSTELENDPRMKLCPLRHNPHCGTCSGRIEWHHVWTYAGRQIDEAWAIVGCCKGHHDRVPGDRTIRELFERETLLIASDEDLAKYPRKDWTQIKKKNGL